MRFLPRWLRGSASSLERLSRPSGMFHVTETRCHGTVRDLAYARGEPVVVSLHRKNRELARFAFAEVRGQGNYLFSFPLAGLVTPDEFLRDEVRIVATNTLGFAAPLKLSGESMLDLINQHMGPRGETLANVQFTLDGNAASFIGEGWSHQEDTLRWSEGPRARLSAACAVREGDRLMLTVLAHPFTALPVLREQRMEMRMNGVDIHSASIGPGDNTYQKISVPSRDVGGCSTVELTFGFPDAARPCDVVDGSRDARRLGFAFRRLTLMRLADEAKPG